MCKCDISKCKARCCYNVYIPSSSYFHNISKVVTPPYYIVNRDGMPIEQTFAMNSDELILPVTDLSGKQMQKCPFLTKDNRCAIQDDKPELCKVFGHPEKFVMLGCRYLGQKEVSDVKEVKVEDLLKNYGLFKKMDKESFDYCLESMYDYVEKFPSGKIKDYVAWCIKNKIKFK